MIVSLEIPPETQQAIARMADRAERVPEAILASLRAAVTRGADAVRELLVRGGLGLTMRNPGQGGLADALFGWILDESLPMGAIGVPSNTPAARYAAIHEYGGVIRPRMARALAIPLTAEARRYESPRMQPDLFPVRTKGQKLILARKTGKGRIEAQWILVGQVRITARHWLSRGAEQSAEDIGDTFGTTLAEELELKGG